MNAEKKNCVKAYIYNNRGNAKSQLREIESFHDDMKN